jgi:hypothetical protein
MILPNIKFLILSPLNVINDNLVYLNGIIIIIIIIIQIIQIASLYTMCVFCFFFFIRAHYVFVFRAGKFASK